MYMSSKKLTDFFNLLRVRVWVRVRDSGRGRVTGR
jgi:hypothetical protein